MSDRWRCFVAIPVGERLRLALIGATSVWREAASDVDLRWTAPAGWHITLAFLGDVDPARVDDTAERLPSLVDGVDGAVELAPDGLVAWPRPAEARMAWCRFRPEPGIGELHNRIAGALGVTERRRFRPHVTLARVRGGREVPLEMPAALEAVDLPTAPATEVVLYRSHLDPAGTTYEPLAQVSLGVRA